jgi:hypothetical protein
MDKDIRPNFAIIRCCRTCKYFRQQHSQRAHGVCRLPLVEDKNAEPLPSFAGCICDAHTWKSDGRAIHKEAIRLGILPPEGTY